MLSIAHRFTLDEIYDRALRELIPPPSIDDAINVLSLVEKYDIPMVRVSPALEMLVRRPEPLSEYEWERMSWTMASHVAQARERYVAKVWEVNQNRSWDVQGNIEDALRVEAASIVESVWKIGCVLLDSFVWLLTLTPCTNIARRPRRPRTAF